MDLDDAKFILSTKLNSRVLIVPSKRSVGKVYKFCKKTDSRYSCPSYKQLGKTRTLTDGKITSVTDPDDGDHPDCPTLILIY